MTEPLIAIEGTLRLPPVRALADPSVTFGREWSPMTTRPTVSQSEFAIAAARLHTAYVDAARLSRTASSYRAASLWSAFSEGQIRQRMLQLMQAGESSGEASPRDDIAAPIPLAVDAPSPAQEDEPGIVYKALRTAIAIGCAAVIVWLLFGHDLRPLNDDPAAALSTADRAGSAGLSQSAAQSAPHAAPLLVAASADIAPAVESNTGVAASATNLKTGAQPEASAKKPDASAEHARAPGRPARLASTGPHRKRTSPASAPRRNAAGGHKPHAAPTQKSHADAQARSQASGAMNVAALYAILQHSPTLDSNAAPRQERRAPDAADAADAAGN
ncbi:hypothetical protein [Caballeronia sp. Lep1P3]|uniref:hypothetical protein n=1 Tax=Caballeronia sp. Lep1P3 TaxID=2878150 RepID=UPI001FD0027D|nr:hypothetical protein [Caballeronia sp. Lep1P3]